MTQDTAIRLEPSRLSACAERIAVPSYDRRRLRAGIVHFGMGAFHRAHQAMYLDRLMNAGKAFDWAVCGVGVMPGDEQIKDSLTPQDFLYTLVEKHGDGSYVGRVIGSILGYLYAPDDPRAVIGRLTDPATRIVSLTVTEGGYSIDDTTGEFEPTDEVAADLEEGTVPRSVFGLLTEALSIRCREGHPPFTVVSCDNLPGNGSLARRAVVGFAQLKDRDLGEWVAEHVRFPNSMVDRITPATTDADREEVRNRFGIEDRWPVVCEPFVQWVLEESFSCGRPEYEGVGVQLVEDVEPYELMKLRLLNASHQGLAYFARLCGYEFVHEAARDDLFQRFLRDYMDREATPTLAPLPGVDLSEYKDTVLQRFANPQIRDTVARVCAESSDRIPKFLLPVARAQLTADGEIRLAAAIVASWARYAEGVDEQGQPIEVVDRHRDRLVSLAKRQAEEPLAFLENRDLFGDLADHQRFVEAYQWALGSLHERGARPTLAALVDEGQ
jgi:mannitol 2-dehydrogenase